MRSRSAQVLGAGPAGLAAALALASAGQRVEVHERRHRVGAKFAGDLHGVENWSSRTDWLAELRRTGIETNFRCAPWHTVHFTNGRWTETLETERPLFYLVERGDQPGGMEHGLLQQLRDRGAEVRFGAERACSDVDIVATGSPAGRASILERGVLFDTAADDLAVGVVDAQTPGGGYGYLLIHERRGCLCVVLFEDFGRASEALERTVERLRRQFDFSMDRPRRIGGTGSFRHPLSVCLEEALCAGEAAGIQDPLFGFGIRTSLRSGLLAARHLGDPRSYDAAARELFAPQTRAGLVTRPLWTVFGRPSARLFLKGLQSHPRPHDALRFGYGMNPAYRALRSLGLGSRSRDGSSAETKPAPLTAGLSESSPRRGCVGASR